MSDEPASLILRCLRRFVERTERVDDRLMRIARRVDPVEA